MAWIAPCPISGRMLYIAPLPAHQIRRRMDRVDPKLSFQDLILRLHGFWARAGLRHPAALRRGDGRGHVPSGHHPARARPAAVAGGLCAALAPPDRRALRREPEPAAALLPVPGHPEADARRTCRTLLLASYGDRPRSALHDIRFVEDDWESPTLGAWGLGWEVWCDGMEITQFTYFQQVGGIACDAAQRRDDLRPGAAGDVRAGRGERLRPRLQRPRASTYGEVFLRAEREYSAHNFEVADTAMLFAPFRGRRSGMRGAAGRASLALPAYDQCIKASHLFNLLDARGVISVTERASLHRPGARPGERLLRGLACRRGRNVMHRRPNEPIRHRTIQ